MSEQEQEIVIGKDGQEGYLSGEQKEWLAEEHPDLAPYADLKFRVADKKDDDEGDDEISDAEVKAARVVSSTLRKAHEEVTQLRQQANNREIADGVEQLLDRVEEVADTLDWDDADEFRRAAQWEAMNHASAIEDDELRQRAFAKLEERVDEDLYAEVVGQWQQAYADQTERDIQEGWAQADAENERQVKTFEAVVELEQRLFDELNPTEQYFANNLIDLGREEIAAMHPGAAQEALRLRVELARQLAAKVEQADMQTRIVHAHGRTKAGVDGRELKELDAHDLGLFPDEGMTTEDVQKAYRRSQQGVRIDRQAAKRQHTGGRGKGMTGAEKLMEQQIALAKKLGIPVHDGATGRRIG